ncbi:MAG: trimeric intracellular cation channel family protein [Eubacteriales bacterium]
MDYFDLFIFVIEIVSITSFGISGAMVAIKKGMDMFGVVILGVVTSIGGGVIRDTILGIHPPKTFCNPTYAIVSATTALITFIIEARHYKKTAGMEGVHGTRFTDEVMFWLDTIGLAIFTVVGVAVGYETGTDSVFILCFVGVITGVGGGLLRDVLAQNMPYIFVKHIYASACVVGSLVCIALWDIAGRIIAMLSGTAVIMLLRYFARKYRWNMPRIQMRENPEKK